MQEENYMSNTNVFYSFHDERFENMRDEELIPLIQSGNQHALNFLINRYKELVNIKVSKYFIVGAEREDIVQEGMIGLYKAIKNFEKNKENSFKTFANLCIERQLITAIKTSNRQKHMPLNSYLSLNTSAYDDESDGTLMDIFDAHTVEDPLDTITKKEYYQNVEEAIDKSLSDFEKQVLQRYIQGESYVDIAQKLGTIGTMTYLNRIKTGNFEIGQAISIDEISEEKIITMEKLFDKKIYIKTDVEKLLNGVKLSYDMPDGLYSLYTNHFIGIGKITDKKLKREIIL